MNSHNDNKPKQRGNDRNPVWDALADIFGDPTTDTNRRLRGKVVASLTRAGATYDEIVRRARAWPLHFSGATLTPTALEKWWDQLGRPPLRATNQQIEELDRQVMRRELDEWAERGELE